MAGGLAGKVTLVTGGASGIGRATALAFAKEGAPIIIADVEVAGGEETGHPITTMGGEARFIRADVSQVADVEALIGKAVQAYGLCQLLRRLRFDERIRGSHHIFTKEGVEEILNLQPQGRQAKPYQVKQVRAVLLRYRLGGRGDER
jgi:NAD(P)-dependent dehydrogenase (short-subunit alcohol dehydrogenase family)